MGKISRYVLARLRGWLEKTPLHPQWLILKLRDANLRWAVGHARGCVIDVGCGEGRLRGRLPSSVRYAGIDYPATVSLGYTGQVDVYADAAALPLADGCADVVVLLDVLEHLRQPTEAVREVARVLAEGGCCLVHVPFMYPIHDAPHDYQRWTAQGLRVLFEAEGFDVTNIEATLSPAESAAALFSIMVAGAVVLRRELGPVRLLFLPLAAGVILATNLAGRVLAWLLPSHPFMTLSYRMVAAKKSS